MQTIDHVGARRGAVPRTLGLLRLMVLAAILYFAVTMVTRATLGQLPAVSFVSLLATGLMALALGPLDRRVGALSARVGGRPNPYQILLEYSDRVASSLSDEEIIIRTAKTLAAATGAERVSVWVKVGTEFELAAISPEERGETRLRATAEEMLGSSVLGVTVPVRLENELAGILAFSLSPGASITPPERALVEDLASQAGIVLRNIRLTAELEDKLAKIRSQTEEIRDSRRRLVEAHDAERRKLERNIHDGAQQHLVALAIYLRSAERLADKDPERAVAALEESRRLISEARETLHLLARGFEPGLLATEGLGAALRAQTSLMPLPIIVEDRTGQRLPGEVEAAAFFACMEAIQNAVKHAHASRITVVLEVTELGLSFTVIDDGRGIDSSHKGGKGLSNIAGRVEDLGGLLEIESEPGKGTVVRGHLPGGGGGV